MKYYHFELILATLLVGCNDVKKENIKSDLCVLNSSY
jgi:hypothetical protein